MSACADQELLLHGLIDGELDAANNLAIERHLNGLRHLPCRTGPAVRACVRASMPSSCARRRPSCCAPDRGAHRRRRQAGGAAAVQPALLRRRSRRWRPAASLALVVAIPHAPAPGIEDQVVASHVRSLLAAHLTDIQTLSPACGEALFNGRIDFAPPVVELAGKGFPLVGGRLELYPTTTPVAALVYRRRLHTIKPVCPAGRSRHGGAADDGPPRGLHPGPMGRRAGLDYWAVSGQSIPTTLDVFAREFAAATKG